MIPEESELGAILESLDHRNGLTLTEPLGFLDFLALLAQARLVLTDSGGIQEETTVLGVSCLTLRTLVVMPKPRNRQPATTSVVS